MLNTALYTVAQIKKLEQQAMHMDGLTAYALMERAGLSAFQELQNHWPLSKRINVFCGKGNNGGDGYVIAYLAKKQGFAVKVFQVGDHHQLPDAASQAYQRCAETGVKITPFHPSLSQDDLYSADVLVDALLGIGIQDEIKLEYAQAISAINGSEKPVMAIDLPSGIHADTGSVGGSCVHAQLTVTFLGLKRGLYTGAAPAYCGEIKCHYLDVSSAVFAQVDKSAELLIPTAVLKQLSPRKKDAHKGDFAHTLIIGGNRGMGGAARLAGEAACRVGSGLVSLATRPEYAASITAGRPELMCHGIHHVDDLMPLLNKAGVIVLGAGLGQDDWGKSLFAAALQMQLPMILDADALNLLAKEPKSYKHWILTPHPGEAARLLGCTGSEIQADRFAAINRLQHRYGGICVLKGVGTLIQSEQGIPQVCTAGNPGMASGGMGDVLGGVIGGLLAQKYTLHQAASIGVLVHSLAADNAAQAMGERGLLASDLLPELRRLVN